MIKKIPIKGISRDPSGQLSSDGMCAESLNVQLDMGEVAPAIAPKQVTDAAGNPISVEGDILFIHKGSNYENVIYRDGTNLLFIATLPKTIGTARSGLVYGGLSYDETINDVKSVGNTVIISTAKDMYYILWRDNAYHFLGNQIPIPNIGFRMGGLESARVVPEVGEIDRSELDALDGISRTGSDVPNFNHENIGDVSNYGSVATRYVLDSSNYHGFWTEYLDSVWGQIDRAVNEQKESGKAIFPIFVRYGVRLYDGTVYAQSIPVLIGADINKFVDVKGVAAQMYELQNGEPLVTVMANAIATATGYSLVMTPASDRGIFDGWRDIVSGVDIFISPQMLPPQRSAARVKLTLKEKETLTSFESCAFDINPLDIDPYYMEDHQEELILNYQSTYLAKSFTLDEFKNISGELLLNDINFSSDYIMAQEALKETSQSMHHYISERLFNYNKRLLLTGAKQELYHGYPYLHSAKWIGQSEDEIATTNTEPTQNTSSASTRMLSSGTSLMASGTNTILRIDLSKTVAVLERGDNVQIRANVIDTEETDTGGVGLTISTRGGIKTVIIGATNEPRSKIISLTAYDFAPYGAYYVDVISRTDASVKARITIYVVEDKNNFVIPTETVLVNGITISPSYLEMSLGSTAKLTAAVNPDNASDKRIKWSTPQGAVTTVDQNGNVKAVSRGTSRIIADSFDGNAQSWIQVIVTDQEGSGETVAVTGLRVSPTTLTLEVGKQANLEAIITPLNATNKTIYWSSQAGDIAPVSADGVVTGRMAGTAMITATTADGGFQATCLVTVTGDGVYTDDDVEEETVINFDSPGYRFVYYLRGDNGENIVVSRDASGANRGILPRTAQIIDFDSTLYKESPVSWLAYPDSRCYRMDVYFYDGQLYYATFRMKQMSLTDVSYAFIGLGEQLSMAPSVTYSVTERSTYQMRNVLVVSKANNPFVFPAEEAVTFTVGEVLNLAVPTLPLSEGQAGQFKLYAFTDEGVYAIDIDSEGKLRLSHPVSRDILVNRDSVVGIEQGVFFSAARGLLLLQGSTVTKVSSLMDGFPMEIEDTTLVGQLSNRFLDFYPESPQQFYKFLADCRLAYDYANTRILLINPAYNTMYVYKFDTQSWHRLRHGERFPVRVMNSYPEAQIVTRSGQWQSVFDYSVVAEADGANALPGLIYTRDLSIESADIYKTIHRLKVRGRFQDGHVKWQLQGSNDGVNYITIHSLRGPSWKWYRIVLVTLLEPKERISYIELDYEPKFTDKIR